ncbi:MAG: tRNA dihydrouridine synthase DusB [Endomicrobium sp.]|jgi:tRNA-dihydrouridine synthase B|nr:tRNA dihydrouridine synthase DusB [Endomicrobium sp.]
MKIGNVSLNNNIVLAPMAAITDLPVRLLAKAGGAGLVYTEMISAKGLIYGDEKTKKLLESGEEEKPVAVQIFGGDAYSMGEAAKTAESLGANIVDINLGCPVKKIAKAGAGAKLLANEKLVSDILERVVQSVKIPVTIKLRIGLLPGQNVAAEIINIAQNCGVKMAAVHARPASQGHSGAPDIDAFSKACQNSKIPVFANGGIIDEKTAGLFAAVPNCAGLMIGRGAIGNYSIFKRIKSFLQTGEVLPEPSVKERLNWLKTHAELSIKRCGQTRGLVIMRKVFHYYVKDLKNAAKMRAAFNKITNYKDFESLIKFAESEN